MKSNDCSHLPYCQVEIDVAKSNDELPPESDVSIDCSMILSQGIPTSSYVDKGMILVRSLDQLAAS